MNHLINKYILCLLVVAVNTYMFAAVPDWNVNSSNYQYSMTVTGPIAINDMESADTNDLVAAFVGGECRGVSHLFYTESVGRYISYLLVYSNTTGETISFKIYDASEDVIYDASQTLNFEINGIEGTVSAPRILSYPELGNNADILSYSIDGEADNAAITDTVITVTMPYGASLDNLVASFSLSPGATAMVAGEQQYSGVTANDFTTGVIYEVTSNDELTIKNYIVNIEFADAPPTDISLSDSTLEENRPIRTVIGYFSSEDLNPSDNHTYSFISGTGDTDNSKFVIEGNVLRVIEVPDYERQRDYSILVRTDDGNGGTFDKKLSVFVENLNDEKPVVTDTTINVAESSLLIDTIYTVNVYDADSLGDFHYYIAGGNTNNTFDINALTGVITLNQGLDYETITSYSLTLEVNDGVNIGSGTLTIKLIDENDEIPQVKSGHENVHEDASIGDTIHQVIVTDKDEGSSFGFSIISGNDEAKFQIDPISGIITLAGELDYLVTNQYALTINVNDGVNSSTGDIQINVYDDNNLPPHLESDSIDVPENTSLNSIIYTVVATDPDSASVLSYYIVDGNEAEHFRLDSASGALTVIDLLDYENINSYDLVVGASDDLHTTQETIHVKVTNINDEVPVVTNVAISVEETLALYDTVFKVEVFDPDGDSSFTYSIAGGNHNSTFAINQSTGIITLEQELDFETRTSYTLTLNADDGLHTGSGELSITILDKNDEVPSMSSYSLLVSELSSIGDTINTLSAIDRDANSTLEYFIISGNEEDKFILDPYTGVLQVNELLDYETEKSYYLMAEVTDGLNFEVTNVKIDVIDMNDEVPVLKDTSISIPESMAVGSVIHIVMPTDADTNTIFKFHISGNYSEDFSIDSVSGKLVVANTLDYELIDAYELIINVSDGINHTTSALTITITDIDESPKMIDDQFTVNENSAKDVVVGQVEVTNTNAEDSYGYEIISGNINEAFTINSAGVISVSKTFELDYEDIPAFYLDIVVTDLNHFSWEDTGSVEINLIDINENPTLEAQFFSISENPENGSMVGTVQSTDVDSGQELSFTIIDGDQNAFGINENTGEITVINGDLIDYEESDIQTLTIEVTDNGIPNLSAEAVVSIEILDAVEPTLEHTNYISPNGDGRNDYWVIQNPELYSGCTVTIYDALGNEVLQQTGYNNDWNGTYKGSQLSNGTYYFIIKCDEENMLYKGYITLIN